MRFNLRQFLILNACFVIGLVLASNSALSAEGDSRGKSHWAFSPIHSPTVPAAHDAAWVRTPVDAFIATKQRERGLRPAAEASRETLIRRLSLDLLGLPPTPDDVRAFVEDASPDAYERLVDRLLASPHYGERWGRHWLDVARWAESEGYESNEYRPTAWRYRDYVVRCFNEDRPFDRFLREQIAGDELTPYSDENLIATGFLAAARYSGNEEDKAMQRNDVLVDIANATASAILGLTLACAQCHDHKFDPLTQRDYYRFQGFFVQGQLNNLLLKDADLWKEYEAALPKDLPGLKARQEELVAGARARFVRGKPPEPEKKDISEKDVMDAFTEDEKKLHEELATKIAELEKQMPMQPQTLGFYSPATSPFAVETLPLEAVYALPYDPEQLKQTRPRLYHRGDPRQPGEEVDVGWPAVFGSVTDKRITAAPRTVLAEWLTSRENPLTARVWANRVWQFHFGQGLVAHANDFGVDAPPPSHPGLLDYLASELIHSGWSTKRLHRLIVNSATYRQGSLAEPQTVAIDPDNQWLARWRSRRLEAEAIRDSILVATGELDRTVGGPSVSVGAGKKYLNDEANSDSPPRRSLYLEARRDVFWPMYQLFDGPPVTESCARRYVSTVALQPLFLLNSQFMAERAKAFADRVATLAGYDPRRQIEIAYEIAIGQSPSEAASAALMRLYRAPAEPASDAGSEGVDIRAIQQVCLVVLNMNEFHYMD
jgi:hypothetical protein